MYYKNTFTVLRVKLHILHETNEFAQKKHVYYVFLEMYVNIHLIKHHNEQKKKSAFNI